MNQEQHTCTKVGHENQVLHGICMDNQCQADQKISCLICLETIHAQCVTQISSPQLFINKLQELQEKVQDRQESKVIQLSQELLEYSNRFIKNLEQLVNKIQNNDKANQMNCIQQILNKQNMLSANDWQQGYSLLTNQLIMIPQNIQSLFFCLHEIELKINQIRQIEQQERIDQVWKETPSQQLIKLDWNHITQQKPLIIKAKHEIRAIAQSPDGKYIASVGGITSDSKIIIWDVKTGNQVGQGMKGHTFWINSINYSKNGKFIVSGSDDKTVRQWNVQIQEQIGQPMFGHEENVTGVQYTGDLKYIISCSDDKTIRFWNYKTGEEHIHKRIIHINEITCLSLCPISNKLAYGDRNGIITLYDYEAQQQNAQLLKGHSKCVCSLQYSADGNYIVSGGDEKAILIWNARSKLQIGQLIGHKKISEIIPGQQYYVRSVSFSPDMRYVISGGWDNTVRLWHRVTGKQVGEPLTHHKQHVTSTQFSIDGKYIITGGWDSQIRIMEAPIDVGRYNQECDIF